MPSTPLAQSRLLVLVVGIGLGGGGGWWLARRQGRTIHFPAGPGAIGATLPNSGSKAAAGPSAQAAPRVARLVYNVADPNETVRELLRVRDPVARTNGLNELLRTLSPEQLAAMFGALKAAAEKQEDKDELAGLATLLSSFELMVRHAAATDPAAVLKELRKPDMDDDFSEGILRAWAETDLQGARDYFAANLLDKENAERDSAAEAIARAFVKQDPDGALAWARSLPGPLGEKAARDALQTLSHQDSTRAGQLLIRNADAAQAPEWAGAMAESWAESEPDKALKWAVGLPEKLAGEAAAASAKTWATRDFNAALTAAQGLSSEARANALRGIADVTDAQDVAKVLPSVESLPESAARAGALGDLVFEWAGKSPEEASQWLTRQPQGLSRDASVGSLARRVMESEPESAMEWAATIHDPAERQQQLRDLTVKWLEKDAPAARRWVQESARLAPEDRAALLERTGR